MKVINYLGAMALSLGVASISMAESGDHFAGKPAGNLQQAVSNFNQANTRLEKMLAKQSLTSENMAAIHELTYTLENALARINADVDELAVTLEEVHLGSEDNDAERVKGEGDKYLSITRDLAAIE